MADFAGKKIRKSNFSPEEIEILVNTVSKHYDILYGEFAKRAVNKHARHRVWLDVTKQVNRVSIERRTLQEVKNKWKKCQHLYRDIDRLEIPEDFVIPNVWEPLTTIKDSMPLEQRLSKTSTEQEPVLQSQPLSPTKLKVTRQSTKPAQSSPKPATPEPPNEEVCLRWNSHHSNMQSTFPNLLLREQYVDATLVAEGQTLKCHRLILSSCSPYFEEVLSGISPFQHPVLFMKDIPFWILKSLCDFMYAGEVHIFQNKLEELLAVAESLKIKGLAGKPEGTSEEVKSADTAKPKEEKEEKEMKDRKKSLQQSEIPVARNTSKPFKSTYTSKRNEKSHKELVKSDDILDPLDLLEPVYEELTKESKPSSAPTKLKDTKAVPVRKALPKKIKKRKLSEEREESPPPLFLSRKGTRSRPNVKIPKYYHATYDRSTKPMELPESTIVREPHTDQADPLMQVEEIKAEPLDLEDDVIEIEDNIVGFSDQELPIHEEEIIGNYDSPIVNIDDGKKDGVKLDDSAGFKNISLLQQPIIMDVHSISEKSEDTLKIVDVSQIQTPSEMVHDKSSDPLATDIIVLDPEDSKAVVDDPLQLNAEPVEKTAEDIKITNVESVVERLTENDIINLEEKVDDSLSFHVENVVSEQGSNTNVEFQIEKVVSENENQVVISNEENSNELGFHIAKVASEQFAINEESKSVEKDIISEDCASELGFQITNVVSGHFVETDSSLNEINPQNSNGIGTETVNELSEIVGESQENKVIILESSSEEDNAHKDSNCMETETIINELSEMIGESQEKKDSGLESGSELANINNTLSEETRCIAESLEELLEK